jgi:hypothetical protein
LLDGIRYRLALALIRAKIRLKGAVLRQGTPILVYQVGKVGSSTVYMSLRGALPRRFVFHIHYLSPDSLIKYSSRMKETFLTSGAIPEHLLESSYLRRKINTGDDPAQWKIVTLVRDPIAIILSGFFFRKFAHSRHAGSVALAEEINAFLSSEYNIQWILDWLDVELKTVFGVDVYQADFPHEQGYGVYCQTDKPDVLVLRLEDLDRCSKDAFANFLGIENFELVQTNRAGKSSYSDVYQDFIETACIPGALLDQVYNSKYARHFYSDEERLAFKSKWLASGS